MTGMTDFETGGLGNRIEDVLERDGELTVCTSGISMYPMLRNRKDMIRVRPVTRPLKRHDVPLYRTPQGKLTLHRIIKACGDGGYIIRGDNLFLNETNITDELIIGVLTGFWRNGKYYDCEKSRAYKAYIAYVRLSYPVRYLNHRHVIPFLSKIRHKLFK